MKTIGLILRDKTYQGKNKVLLPLYIITLCFIACTTTRETHSNYADCVSEYDSISNQQVYVFVDQMPEYPGGNQALLRFIIENFEYSKEGPFQASFLIEFIIDEKGQLIAPRIRNKHYSALTEMEKEILIIVSKTTGWNAGSCNNKTVPVKMILPLKF